MTTLHAELLPDGTCVLRDGDVERWRTSLSLREAAAWNPFREAILWPRAHCVVAGAGDRVHILDLDTGTLCTTLDLAPDCFGHLVLVELPESGSSTDILLVLGWTDVRAYAPPDATLRWHARHVAVDGITFDALDGTTLRLHAEMDPPGGWFAVSLDVATGHELERHADFLPGYVGLHGQGPDAPHRVTAMPPTFADRVRSHPANARILAWLGVAPSASAPIEPWVDHGFDQGAQTLFDRHAAALPTTTRYSISCHAVLVHPDTAVIFAALHGRFTFLVRRPPGAPASPRLAETLDAWVHLDGLEDEWGFLACEEEAEQLEHAHAAAGRVPG